MSFSEPDLDAYIRERLHEALADLSVDDISLLQLHYCEGRTVAQIAEFLGGTSDAVFFRQACLTFRDKNPSCSANEQTELPRISSATGFFSE